jgi:hypothetical protein
VKDADIKVGTFVRFAVELTGVWEIKYIDYDGIIILQEYVLKGTGRTRATSVEEFKRRVPEKAVKPVKGIYGFFG